MRASGAVEFALAFSLMWTPLVRRVGAVILTAMFVSAVFDFGKIDLIGHSLIVVALSASSSMMAAEPSRCGIAGYFRSLIASSLAIFLATYYFGHAALFGTTVL